MLTNRERFKSHKHQCQGCGALGHEDSGLLCDDCKKEIGPNWKVWLDQEQEIPEDTFLDKHDLYDGMENSD